MHLVVIDVMLSYFVVRCHVHGVDLFKYLTPEIQVSKTILFSIFPMPGTSTSTTSPSFSHPGGFSKAATPLGVPVMSTVPALNVIPRLICLIMAETSNIKSFSPVLCFCTPFTIVLRNNLLGSGICDVEQRTGPIGANLSNDFAYPCCPPERSLSSCQKREETSFPTVYPST